MRNNRLFIDNAKWVEMNWAFLRNVIIKSFILFLLVNIVFALFFPLEAAGKISLYNNLFPGRERFPFGENPAKAYNLSLYNLNAMFASHRIAGTPKGENEFRVFVIGDSSVWGTLLKPEETLSSQLDTLALTTSDGREMRFYNLGYPTVSLTKDVMLLEKTMQYHPDLIIWLVTLEAFPWDKQYTSPLVENNIQTVQSSLELHGVGLPLLSKQKEVAPVVLDNTIVFRRRELADLIRLQFYGVLWAATEIDQEYFENYPPAQRDFEIDDLGFHDFTDGQMTRDDLAFQVLDWGSKVAGATPVLVVNEPMLISTGENSEFRYNFFYPKWAYDQYREWLSERSKNSLWSYLDNWNLVPEDEFTNSAIHLTPTGSRMLAEEIAQTLLKYR